MSSKKAATLVVDGLCIALILFAIVLDFENQFWFALAYSIFALVALVWFTMWTWRDNS